MAFSASIIIPVFNAENTLRKCVESLVYGEEKNIEILLLEDCSSDDSWKVCQTLSKEHENVFSYKNETNRGVSYTRNKGLKYATAPYVLFVDSDDWVSKKYVKVLLETARLNQDYFPLCGYLYIDYLTQERAMYGCEQEKSGIKELRESFALLDDNVLQLVWNKIFSLEIIRKNKVYFDESLAMGEDFKFVLAYLEASDFSKFMLVAEPLYYYVRATSNSLMASWSEQALDDAVKNYEKLYYISNEDNTFGDVLETHIKSLKENLVYHIIRNNNFSMKEQMKRVHSIFSKDEAESIYKNQIKIKKKEQIVNYLSGIKKLYKRIENKYTRIKNRGKIYNAKRQIKENDITIISQNCIGGVFYHDMEKEFLSPTINTFIPEPDFVKFVLNLKYYLEQEIVMLWDEEYPIGMLDDISVHFMHYSTCKDAKESWERRKARINWNKIFVLGTDRDGFCEETYQQWKLIDYPKLLYTANKFYSMNSLCLPDKLEQGQVGDLIFARDFYRGNILVSELNKF